jgi:hypothetical protein
MYRISVLLSIQYSTYFSKGPAWIWDNKTILSVRRAARRFRKSSYEYTISATGPETLLQYPRPRTWTFTIQARIPNSQISKQYSIFGCEGRRKEWLHWGCCSNRETAPQRDPYHLLWLSSMCIWHLAYVSRLLIPRFKFRSSRSPQPSKTESPIGTELNPDSPAEAAHIGSTSQTGDPVCLYFVLKYLDHTPESALKRARRHLSEAEAELYLNEDWRFRIIKWVYLSVSKSSIRSTKTGIWTWQCMEAAGTRVQLRLAILRPLYRSANWHSCRWPCIQWICWWSIHVKTERFLSLVLHRSPRTWWSIGVCQFR